MDSVTRNGSGLNRFLEDIKTERGMPPGPERSRFEFQALERAIPLYEQSRAELGPLIPGLKRLIQISANLKPATISDIEAFVNEKRVIEDPESAPFDLKELLTQSAEIITVFENEERDFVIVKQRSEELHKAFEQMPLPHSTQPISDADLSMNPKIRSTGQIARANGGVMNPEEEL